MATCPDCRQRMQAFYVPARGGAGEVELDRCGQCGALWFNAGEVETALGRTVRRRQGTSSRSCPSCRVKLEAAMLEGKIEVERCGSCEGVFLDGHDVDELGQKRTTQRRTSGGSGFECEGCGQRRPFSEAQCTVTGLLCAGCSSRMSAVESMMGAEKRSMLDRFFIWLGSD